MSEEGVPTLTVVTSKEVQSKLRGSGDAVRKLEEEGIPLNKLQQGYSRFLESMRAIFEKEEGRVGSFVLEEITFSAEIGASGDFKLLGTGAGISANSGVTFTLRREPREAKREGEED